MSVSPALRHGSSSNCVPRSMGTSSQTQSISTYCPYSSNLSSSRISGRTGLQYERKDTHIDYHAGDLDMNGHMRPREHIIMLLQEKDGLTR
jgi:hypothetical protein